LGLLSRRTEISLYQKHIQAFFILRHAVSLPAVGQVDPTFSILWQIMETRTKDSTGTTPLVVRDSLLGCLFVFSCVSTVFGEIKNNCGTKYDPKNNKSNLISPWTKNNTGDFSI
jgi:hypothetical protein